MVRIVSLKKTNRQITLLVLLEARTRRSQKMHSPKLGQILVATLHLVGYKSHPMALWESLLNAVMPLLVERLKQQIVTTRVILATVSLQHLLTLIWINLLAFSISPPGRIPRQLHAYLTFWVQLLILQSMISNRSSNSNNYSINCLNRSKWWCLALKFQLSSISYPNTLVIALLARRHT